jgi:hypothetical protein
MGIAVDGIEPCQTAEATGMQCMCGIELDSIAKILKDEGEMPLQRCRLCSAPGTHHRYIIQRGELEWGIIVCPVCTLVCDEY